MLIRRSGPEIAKSPTGCRAVTEAVAVADYPL
jgi:hypothetical protein